MSVAVGRTTFLLFVVAVVVCCVGAIPLPDLLAARDLKQATHHLYLNIHSSQLDVSRNATLAVENPELKHLATAIVNNSINVTGWDFVQISPDKELLAADASKAYYYAGYLEGYLTQERMRDIQRWQVAYDTWYKPSVRRWVNTHIQYMRTESTKNILDPFWGQVHKILSQMDGVSAGYNVYAEQTGNSHRMAFYDVFQLNFNNEIDAVDTMTESVEQWDEASQHRASADGKRGHCSALVRVTDNDIFFGHDTWAHYDCMVRQYKIYQFETTIVMDSYAGYVQSSTDWYMTSRNLASMETSISFKIDKLAELISPNSVSEYIRVMVANYLATSAPEWVRLFSYNNSGTYNNEWMVLDYNLYTPGEKGALLKDNLFWVADQMPGMVQSGDVTDVLREKGYFASYNIPHFDAAYNRSGFQREYQRVGNFLSYTKTARAEIFERNHTDVVDLDSMMSLMRYNNWQHDPLSKVAPQAKGGCGWPPCWPATNGFLSVASRGDLVSGGSVIPEVLSGELERDFYGAIDTKITSFAMLHHGMQSVAILGPTTSNGLPVFSWDPEWTDDRPVGSSDRYDFDWYFFNSIQLQ